MKEHINTIQPILPIVRPPKKASTRNLLETQILSPYPIPTILSEALEVGPSDLTLTNPVGDFSACSSLRTPSYVR